MRISDETLMVLKNFSTIYDSLLIRKGNVLTTGHPMGYIVAQAIVEEEFPIEAPIFGLNQTIGLMSLFKAPEVEFETNKLVIAGPTGKVSVFYTAPNLIKAGPEDCSQFAPQPSKILHTVELSTENLKSLWNAVAILKAQKIAYVGDGENVWLQTWDDKQRYAGYDNYASPAGKSDKKFTVVIGCDSLKLLPKDYTVTISADSVMFSSQKLTYWIAPEKKSK